MFNGIKAHDTLFSMIVAQMKHSQQQRIHATYVYMCRRPPKDCVVEIAHVFEQSHVQVVCGQPEIDYIKFVGQT